MTSPAARVLARARREGRTLAVAESLTGGLVSAALTEVPGASAVLRGGVVAYTAGVKVGVLRVPQDVLDRHGAVSRATAEAMARGVTQLLGADWGLATTGVAGPGPDEGRPAGTVHIAVHGTRVDGEEVRAHRVLSLHGDRREIRESTVREVLDLLEQVWSEGIT